MRVWVAVLALVIAVLTLARAAARHLPPASTHTRVGGGAVTTLSLHHVTLTVPRGAVARGAVVGLGVGGVPAPPGTSPLGSTGLVIAAAGGLRGPVVVVVALTTEDVLALGGAYPALLDAVTGAVSPCFARDGLVGCRADRPSAYLIVGGSSAAPGDVELQTAITRAQQRPATSRRNLGRRAVALAIMAAGSFGIVWWWCGRTAARNAT